MDIPESKVVKVIFRTRDGRQGVANGILRENGQIECKVPSGAQVLGTQRHNERIIRAARVDSRKRGDGRVQGIIKPSGLFGRK